MHVSQMWCPLLHWKILVGGTISLKQTCDRKQLIEANLCIGNYYLESESVHIRRARLFAENCQTIDLQNWTKNWNVYTSMHANRAFRCRRLVFGETEHLTLSLSCHRPILLLVLLFFLLLVLLLVLLLILLLFLLVLL